MSKKVNFEDSQYAIRDYIYSKDKNYYQHKAIVLVSSQGKKQYSGTLSVRAKIETNNSFVEIVGDKQFEQDYYLGYTNEYQNFTFIDGTLLIECKDKKGIPIEISITSC